MRRLVVLERQLEQSEAVNVRPWVSGELLQPKRALAVRPGGIDISTTRRDHCLHTDDLLLQVLRAQLSCKLRGFFGQLRGMGPVPGGPLDPAQLAERLGKPFIVGTWTERADARQKVTGTLILIGHGQQRPVCRCGEGRADWAAFGELERTLEQVAVDPP